jgi:signal transduction histidine kinase
MAEIVGANSIEVTCLLVDEKRREYGQFHHRLQSLLHQIVTSVGNQLLVQEKSRRHKQGKELLQRVLKGQEEERRRVSRELHDTLAQDLAAHRLHIERLNSDRYLDNKQEMKKSLNELENNASRMLLSLREIMFDLRPSILEEMGFLPAIQWYLERLETKNSIDGILKIKGSEQPTSYLVQITLFRIFQEALQNIVGHAEASMVNVTVEYSDKNYVNMKIKDDGKGFDLFELENDRKSPRDRGLGILGMKERSELINAMIDITSEIEQGTTISIKCPLELK